MALFKNFKVIICGNPAVGKTTLVNSFVNKEFREQYSPTSSANIKTKAIDVEGKKIGLIVTDIAGQIKVEKIRKAFFSGAKLALLVFEVTKNFEPEKLDSWLESIKQHVGDIPVFLVATKIDLKRERIVESLLAKEYATANSLSYYEVSGKTGENVLDVFHEAARTVYKKDNKSI